MNTLSHYATRDLVRCQCDICGSAYNVLYDKFHDEYICKECLDLEEQESEEEGEFQESQEQQRNEQREADFKRRDRE
jgi:hypothetical protein